MNILSGQAFGSSEPMRVAVRIGAGIYFLLIVAFCFGPWIRPPVSPDIRGVQSPLSMFKHRTYLELDDEIREGNRAASVTSPGVILFVVSVFSMVLTIVRPVSYLLMTGLTYSMVVASISWSAFCQPQLYDLLDQQLAESRMIVRGFSSCSTEFFSQAAPGRPESFMPWDSQRFFSTSSRSTDVLRNDLFGFRLPPGSFARGLLYQRLSLVLYIVSLAGFLLLQPVSRSVGKRIVALGGFSILGMVIASPILVPACLGHYYRSCAEDELRKLNAEAAKSYLQRSNEVFPALELTQFSLGVSAEIDFRTQNDTAAATIFIARQFIAQRQYPNAIDLLESVAPCYRTPVVSRLASEAWVQMANAELQDRNYEDAACHFHAATEIATRIDAQIGEAVCRVHARSITGEQLANQLDLIFPKLGSAVIRSDLYSLVGDAFANQGDLQAARSQYQLAYEELQMPRYINYYAQDKLLGF